MVEKRSLSELSVDQFISPTEAKTIALNILAGRPGLFTVTGQPSTGKTTTLLILAQQAWLQGVPITLLTSDQDLLEQIHLSLPPDWAVHYVDATEQAWENAVNQYILPHPGMAMVTDQLVGFNNTTAAMMATKAGHWVLACLDTPFVGLDVLYVLRALSYTSQDLVDNLVGILSQMLLPTLCADCGQLLPATLAETVLVYPDSDKPRELWREVGCPTCGQVGTGGGRKYGRCALFEVLQIDDEVRPLVAAYLEQGSLGRPTAHKHFTLWEGSRELVKQGMIGIQTYQRFVLQNPLLRTQHFWEQASLRADRIQGMFGRFVTQQLVDKLMLQSDFEHIIEGEHREVTCFFCDVRGFTSRAEQSSAVDLFSTLNQYFREIIDIVFQYQGTIDKFIGDSVMVVFGAPVAQVDHALLAVECAIAVQKKVADLNSQVAFPMRMGIGINSGEVIAGCIGSDRRMDYTVLGDVINIAARLESQAQPNQILLGPTTHAAVQSTIDCQGVGAIQLKGKAEPVEVFEVIYS